MGPSSRMDGTSSKYSSPFGMDNLFRDANKKRSEEIRSAIYHALALAALFSLILGTYYALVVLEPFLIPIFWALLTGFILFPYKASFTENLKKFLKDSGGDSGETAALWRCLKASPRVLNDFSDALGDYLFVQKIKFVLGFLVLGPLLYLLYVYCFQVSMLLEILGCVLNIWRIIGEVVSWPYLTLIIVGYLSNLILLRPSIGHEIFLKVYSNVLWLVVGCVIFQSLPEPLFYLFLALLGSLFYFGRNPSSDGADSENKDAEGQKDSVRNYVYDLLRSFNQDNEVESNCALVEELMNEEEEKGLLEKKETKDKEEEDNHPVSSTPAVSETGSTVPSTLSQNARSVVTETPILHPGVSALRRGRLLVSQSDNRSSSLRYSSSSTSRRNPRRVLICHGDSTIGLASEELPSASYIYLSWVFWACCVIQLWVHPVLLHLLPLPIIYFSLKRLAIYLELMTVFKSKYKAFSNRLYVWFVEKRVLIIPYPLRCLERMYFNAEKRTLKLLPDYADSLVTGFLILSLIFVVFVVSVFVSFQLYYECLYIIHTSGEVVAELSNSTIFRNLGIFDGAESYVETAYTQGRSYLSSFLKQHNISGKDNEEFEQDVLRLFDRMYQYWLDRNYLHDDEIPGPRVNGEALASSVEDIAFKIKDSLSLSMLSQFIQDNMETLTSVLEHSWTLVKGNAGIVLNLLIELVSVLFQSGSGFVNFLIGLVVYFTALFYLLSASDKVYFPVAVVSELSIMGDDFAMAMNKAVKSVFIITFKISTFYGLWTYLTHTVFSASIVMVPVLAATFLAAVPVAGQYLVAIPAAAELWFAKGRIASAICLVLCHFAPMCIVDASIYAEVKRGIHPWVTALSIVGGIYCFGIPGAIYGPLIVCAVYVVLTVYTGFMTADITTDNIGTTTAKTPNLHRADTVL